ncbi:MAG TPA: carboxymuconolactone decarboxylase family protein [Pseudonocardia sp.]
MPTNPDPIPTPTLDAMRRDGNWNPLWNTLSDWDPEWTEQFMAMNATPVRRGVFTPEFVELLSIAIDAAATHMYAPGVRRHIRMALELGVSREEILTVLQMVSVLGIHACNLGVPILEEELDTHERRQIAAPRIAP